MTKPQGLSARRLLVRAPFQAAILVALVFAPAGTFAWVRGWVFVVLSLLAAGAMTTWLYLKSPDLLKERLQPLLQEDQPLADKLVTIAFVAASLAWFVFTPYDVFHLRLLPPPPLLLSWLGLGCWFLSAWIIFLTFRENAFAAPIVKHQAERRQTVVDTGPYAAVRHPMYAGIVLYALGVPLWLGSTAGVLLAAVPLGVLVLRLLVEEAHLRRHLLGYEAYMRKVRWRLVPGLW